MNDVFDWGHQHYLKYNAESTEMKRYNKLNRIRQLAGHLKVKSNDNNVDPECRWYKSRWGGWKYVLNYKHDAIREKEGELSYVSALRNVEYFINMHYHMNEHGEITDIRLCVATLKSLLVPHPNVTVMHDEDPWDWRNMVIPEEASKDE
jgi:hypothetical protein